MLRLGLLLSAFLGFSSQHLIIWISQSCRRKRLKQWTQLKLNPVGPTPKPCKLKNKKKVFCCKAPRLGDYLIDSITLKKLSDGYAIISFAWTALPRPLC